MRPKDAELCVINFSSGLLTCTLSTILLHVCVRPWLKWSQVQEKFKHLKECIHDKPYEKHVITKFYAIENALDDSTHDEQVRVECAVLIEFSHMLIIASPRFLPCMRLLTVYLSTLLSSVTGVALWYREGCQPAASHGWAAANKLAALWSASTRARTASNLLRVPGAGTFMNIDLLRNCICRAVAWPKFWGWRDRNCGPFFYFLLGNTVYST